MVEWNELDVTSFLEQATGFLAEHGQLDGPSCHAPPAKRARSVGVTSCFISHSVCCHCVDCPQLMMINDCPQSLNKLETLSKLQAAILT